MKVKVFLKSGNWHVAMDISKYQINGQWVEREVSLHSFRDWLNSINTKFISTESAVVAIDDISKVEVVE